MKKVWIINHYADPPGPGKFTRHFNFAKKLTERGYDVKIFTASTIHTTDINFITNQSTYKEQVFDGINYVFIKTCTYNDNGIKRIRNMMEYFFRVMMATKKFGRCDVVYTSAPHSLTWLAANVIAKRNKAPLIAETRDLWPETFVALGKMKPTSIPARILYKIEKFIYKKADRLIFTFPGGKDYVKSIGVDDTKVRYINNGIDLNDYQKKISEGNYSDEDLDNESIFKVVFAGALGKANDLGRVLKSFKLLQDQGYDNIKWLIYGSGGEEKELKEFVKNNNITNVVFKGRVEKKEIPSILAKSDLQLLSLAHAPQLFKYGLSPNKLFEYLASGKPIISNVECGYDILKQYDCGKTVKGDSVEAMAQGIIEFYNMEPEIYQRYCNNALNAAKDFDFEILTDRLQSTIEEVGV